MEAIELGKKLDGIAGTPEGMYFNAGASGYTLMYNFNGPTQKEIDAVTSGSPFEIRWTTVGGILVITAKAGSLAWVDAPFAPQLCQAVDSLVMPSDNHAGTALMVLMTDAKTGIVKSIRMIGLGNKFSTSLLTEIQRINKEPFEQADYDARLALVQSKYSSKDIAQMASSRYKVEK